MRSFIDQLRNRVVPALLTAAGIALVAAGLLSYSAPASAEPPGGSSTTGLATDSPATTFGILSMPPLPSPYASGSGDPPPSLTATATPVPTGVASRIVISGLDIDLPVVKPPPGFPYCDVAMYFDKTTTPGVPFVQPGQTGAVYIFALARTNMFLPLLTRSWTDNGSSMLGLLVSVYTKDDWVYTYKISRIHRHVPLSVDLATMKVQNGQLWLQTSEGDAKTPATSYKLQVVADLLYRLPADPSEANPTPHPRVCA